MLPPPWFSLQNAALLYFKRFFSQASCVEHDAMRVMATCVYLACKVGRFSGAQSAGSEGVVGHSVLMQPGYGRSGSRPGGGGEVRHKEVCGAGTVQKALML